MSKKDFENVMRSRIDDYFTVFRLVEEWYVGKGFTADYVTCIKVTDSVMRNRMLDLIQCELDDLNTNIDILTDVLASRLDK